MIEGSWKVAPAVTDLAPYLQTPKNMRLFVRGYVSLAIAQMLFRTLPTETRPELVLAIFNIAITVVSDLLK